MKMSRWIRGSIGVAVSLMLWGGPGLAQSNPAPANPTSAKQSPAPCDSRSSTVAGAKIPEKIQGQVIRVDPDQGKLTLQDTDGTVREFHASKEVVQQYKVGDRVVATLRPGQNCKPNA
jgi:hypothetical protein